MIEYIDKKLPIYTKNIGDPYNLSSKILEYQRKNPSSFSSNVKAWHRIIDPKTEEQAFILSVNKIVQICDEISKEIYNCKFVKHACCHMWIMHYEEGDYAVEHNHYPVDYTCIYYIDVCRNSSPLIIENQMTITPEKGLLVIFPGILNHKVNPTKSARVAMALNVVRKFVS